MLAKAPKAVREKAGLTKWQDYHILNQKGTVAEVTTSDDLEGRDGARAHAPACASCVCGITRARASAHVRGVPACR